MILLTDNDILVKLSQCDLIGEALTVFGCPHQELHILDTAKHSLFLRNPDKCIAKRVGTSQAYERLCEFVGGCSELGAAVEDLDFLDELSQMEHIDPGEQQLLLHAYDLYKRGNPYLLTTGDRKALEGVIDSNSAAAKAMLHQRVECTESLIIKAMDIYGFEYLNTKVGAAATTTPRFDSVLRLSFGQGRDQQHAVSCLQSYLTPVAPFIRA